MLDYVVAPYEGKGAGEQALLRQLLSRIHEGDIILGDAHFENYFLLVLLQLAGLMWFLRSMAPSLSTFVNLARGLAKKTVCLF